MVEWIRHNSDILSLIANYGMLLIWLFYAQLLFDGYRRERRPRMFINKGVSTADLDAPCLICNMSKEPVFVQSILVDLATSAGTFSASATDPDEGEIDQAKARFGERTRQGPLHTGSCMEVPKFGILLQRAADAGGIKLVGGKPESPDLALHSLTVTVVSIYGPEDDPFGATRTFRLSYDDSPRVRLSPASLDTRRLNSRREKRRIKQWLYDYL